MTVILGISAYYHDSAAALVVDGRIVAAAQEERFTRKKHDSSFPTRAVESCLEIAGLKPTDLDWVGFYEKPLLKFDRLMETYSAFAPSGFLSFRKAMPEWIRTKLFLSREMRKSLRGAYHRRFVFAEHHESHAASAFYPSPFEEAAILTLDGVGEWATATIGVGQGNRIEIKKQLSFPHSLGLLYSAFTYYCGFRVNSGEYKLMGLAPYGRPTYAKAILESLIDLKDDGSFRMDQSYFQYANGLTMTSPKFDRLFGGPPRKPETRLGQREMDLAASIQSVTELIVSRMAYFAHKLTGQNQLCLAGGVALNCVANGELLRNGPFEKIWIQPSAGDAGGALGVALWIHHQMLGRERVVGPQDSQQGSLLGPEFSDSEIERFLKSVEAQYTACGSDEELCELVASALAEGQVVGWFQGRMEYGPRALGSRSILGDPRCADMQSTMNLKIKFRESFRPFAPAVLCESAANYFDIPRDAESPYMLLVAPVSEELRLPVEEESQSLEGIEKLNIPRSSLPAVTHVDYSARVQTVDSTRNPLFHQLIRQFASKTGCPVLINTSFNVRGEPIVGSPADAYRCFLATNIDCLAVGRFVLRKANNGTMQAAEVAAHLAQFHLD